MERNREARRSNLVPSNGLSRRRQRSNNPRDSPEDGEIEMQEAVGPRERASKRERGRDLLNRSKRRRADKMVLQESNNREEGEESMVESSGEEEDYEAEQLNNHKISPSATVSRQGFPLKVADEMIRFPVPRKARSASGKKSHENLVTGNGGFVEEQNHRRTSISPARRSVESDRVSPSSSNDSVGKKMTRLPKATKRSSSFLEVEDIAIAEVLYGLMKQSQSSKKEDSAVNPLPKAESDDANGFSTNTKPSASSQIVSSAQSQLQTSVLLDPFDGVASKKKKVEAEHSPTPVKVENEQQANIEICSPKQDEISVLSAVISEYSLDKGASRTASVLMESRENVVMIKRGDSKPSVAEEPKSTNGAVTREKSVSTEKESAKLDVDFHDSTVTKATLTEKEGEIQPQEKFKIDLMAPPPMVSSPERDSPVDITSDPKHKVLDTESKLEALAKDEGKVVKRDMKAEYSKDKKMDTIREKRDSLILDLERSHQDNGSDRCGFEQHGQKQQLSKSGIPKVEKTAQSSSVPLPITLAGWPNGMPPLGYMPPFQAIAPMDGSTRSSTASQPPHFLLPQPRPKRCALHQYIARNIHLHQQFTKMNPFWPPVTGSASLCGAKTNNLSVAPYAENLIPRNPLQGSLPVVNLNTVEEKSKVAASFPSKTGKNKSSDCTMDSVQKKQVAVQQASQPAPAGNLMHGPTFIFPLSQHQTMANQSGPSKSATSSNKASLTNNSTPGISTSSTAIPGVAAAMSFNYSNLGANEAPYFTILQNNGYPFAISSSVGNLSAIRGGTATQALPFFNGSFYSSQMFHPQLQQQQALSQPQVQPAYQNAVTSSGSSSSHKQPESQQPRGGQVSGNNFLSSTSMHSQQFHNVLPSNQSRKIEPEMNGENTTANAQKSVLGQNLARPHQSVNFALVPAATVGGVNGNHGEKQLSQQKILKGGVDLAPPQAFAMSFASFPPGSNIASNLNFSSMVQNPTIFHSLPEVARQGYQVTPVPQATKQKNHQISDGKNGTGSTNLDDGKKVTLGKSHATNTQTYVFDNSAKSLNFVSSPVTGNWPPCSIMSTTVTVNPPVATNSSNSQHSQQQLLQLQKQHMLQQHQQQPATVSRSKTQTTNTMPASSIAAKFSSNAAIFPQAVPQSDTGVQSTPWKNTARTPASPGTNVPAVKNFPQQPSRHTQGQSQISFGVNSKCSLSLQGQEMPTSSQSASHITVVSPPSNGSLRTSSTNSKAGSLVPTLQSQQSENSSTGSGQKSSPVCGRNVPSILSTCPGHLSELKY